jgi:hypothetical protein
MTTRSEVDRQRRRWIEARRSDRLDLDVDGGFATGGLGGHVEALDLRIRFLPADPLACVVRLDEAAAEWLSERRPSPYGGHDLQLGGSSRATSSAVLRYDQYREEQGWARFTALHRNGGLDYGEGGVVRQHRERRAVALRPIVGLIWYLSALQVEAVARWAIEGPFEVSVALVGVDGAVLGGVAEGWRDVDDIFFRGGSACIEPNVLLRVECDGLNPEALAYDFGERLENAFGSTERRFLARVGQFEDRFDPRF